MAKKKTPKNASEILKALHEFILGPEEDVTTIPREKIQADLKAEGLNPAPLVARVREKLNKMKAEEELTRARNQRKYLLDLRGKMPKSPLALKEQILEHLRSLLANRPEMASAYFRKFEEANEADMRSLLEDLAMLDEMGKDDIDESRG